MTQTNTVYINDVIQPIEASFFGPQGIQGTPGADLSQVGTLAQAKAMNILSAQPGATQITLTDRGTAVWRKWNIIEPVLPSTLADYTWFQDAGGTRWRLRDRVIDIEHLGSKGGEVNNDTRCFIAASAWISYGYASELTVTNHGLTYLLKDGDLAWYPAGAIKTEITTMGNFSGSTIGVAFCGVTGLVVRGIGFPLVKRGPSGCTVNNLGLMGLGMFNFKRCKDVFVWGFDCDAARLDQLHSTGARTKSNHNFVIWGDCENLRFFNLTVRNSGTLCDDADKAGDGFYTRGGMKRFKVHGCNLLNPGRMHITFERPIDIYANDLPNQTQFIDIYDNYIETPLQQEGGTAYAIVDFEARAAVNDFSFRRNRCYGIPRISYGGSTNQAGEQICSNISIEDNLFDFTTDAGAHLFNYPLNFSSTYVALDIAVSPTMRTMKGLRIIGNTFVNNQILNADIIRIQSLNVQDFTCTGNVYIGPYNAANQAFIGQVSATFEGAFTLQDNDFGAVGIGFLFTSAFATMSIRSQLPVDYLVKDNRGTGTGWGLRGTLPAHPAGSTFTLDGNRISKQVVRTDIVAAAFVAGGGKAKAINNFFDSGGNALTGFVVPGTGLGTLLNGNAFVDITHGLQGAPTTVTVTSRSAVVVYQEGVPGATTFRVRPQAGGTGHANTDFYWSASNISGQ